MNPRRGAAFGFAVLGLVLGVQLHRLRAVEAMGTAAVMNLCGAEPGRLNATVWVQTPSRWPAGVNIVTGCSVGLLLIPLAFVTGLILVTGRVPVLRAVAAFAVAAALVTVLNQIRYAITLYAIHRWGFEAGYGQSHVLIGSLVSTVGIVAATAILSVVLLRRSEEPTDG